MNILERFLNLFNRNRQAMLGAMSQPVNLMDYVNLVRGQAYQKITGKRLQVSIPKLPTEDAEDLKHNLSPSRRLARKDL
ncbi:hypothetical protein EU524_01660 [Candidatus Thorarchaeota archaeon]|jgi:hypothetical protein|nr:MAG: hypothetical protein EU524_01660 [Candidatus Thorarchaeota archaeon]